MKLFARPKYFSKTIAFVTILNCLFGLRVFEYPRGHPRPVLSLIYLLLLYGIFGYGLIFIEGKYYENIKVMKLEYIMYLLLRFINIVSVILKMLLGWWYTQKFKVCHKKIFEIDETLRRLGLSPNYDTIYFVTFGIVIIWITMAFIMSSVIFLHLEIRTDVFTSIFILLIYTFSLTVNAINNVEFYIFVKYLQIQFKLVNRLLCESLINISSKKVKLGMFELNDYAKLMNAERKQILSTKVILRLYRRVQSRSVLVPEKQDPVVSQIESHFPSKVKEQNELRNRPLRNNDKTTLTKCQERIRLLQIIKQLHLELCKVSKIICTILGVQIAWEIGVDIMYLTGSFYILSIRYIMPQYKYKYPISLTALTLAQCFSSVLKSFSASRICKDAADEGNKTMEIIHAIYGCDADTDMQEEIQQFGIQILQSPVIFSVFGLTLDNRVLSMILKTVSTYMVLMVQVSIALELNEAIKDVQF